MNRKTNNLILLISFILSCMPLGYTADQHARDITTKDYIEIHCSKSGGMRQVIFEKHLFTFIETVEKKTEKLVRSASLDSFVEIQKRTRINKSQEMRLHDWIIKHKISEIEIIPPSEKSPKGLDETRYTNNLMIYFNGKEYILDHHTIKANNRLQKSFDELFEIAREFTATVGNN